MEDGKYITIDYQDKSYQIEKEKLMYVIQTLDSKNKISLDETSIKKFIRHHKLLDEHFLGRINKLW